VKKHFNSIRLASSLLAIIILTVSALCVNADGETASAADLGYDTLYTHVYTPMSIVTPTDTTVINEEAYALNQWLFKVEKSGEITDMKAGTAEGTGASTYIPFTGEGVSSLYKFFCSTKAVTNVNSYERRGIKYIAAEEETMKFGFSVPQDGEYLITAPLAAEGALTYSLIKSDSYGSVYLKEPKAYEAEKQFCNIQAQLKAGDTVWFTAKAESGAVIDIGMPVIAKISADAIDSNSEEGTSTYTYRAADWFEKNADTGYTYYAANATASATENRLGVWSFGYFTGDYSEETADDSTTTYKWFSNLNIETTVGSENPALINALKTYEILYQGANKSYNNVYNAISAIGNRLTAGAMTLGTANAKGFDVSVKETDIFAATLKAVDGTAYGAYYSFTAPQDGDLKIRLADKSNTGAYNILTMLNGKVIEYSEKKYEQEQGNIDVGNVEQGDQLTVCLFCKSSSSEGKSEKIGQPYAYLTVSDTADGADGNANGDENTDIADLVRISEYLNKEIIITTKNFSCADMNQDGVVNNTDLTLLQKQLLNIS